MWLILKKAGVQGSCALEAAGEACQSPSTFDWRPQAILLLFNFDSPLLYKPSELPSLALGPVHDIRDKASDVNMAGMIVHVPTHAQLT